jgi:hypothetical protein
MILKDGFIVLEISSKYANSTCSEKDLILYFSFQFLNVWLATVIGAAIINSPQVLGGVNLLYTWIRERLLEGLLVRFSLFTLAVAEKTTFLTEVFFL